MTNRPAQPFRIRPLKTGDKPAILALVQSLDKYFPEDVVSYVDTTLAKSNVLIGEIDKEIVGFLVYTMRDSQTAEILSMAVGEEYHGLGLGSMLLETLERKLQQENVKKLIASTLSYTVPYKPYEKVRAFYYHRGFTSLGIQNNYYEEGLDRLILVKNLF